MFVGREKELKFFQSKFDKDTSQLIVLYGRRRIGKTELLKEFSMDKKHVFYACNECEDKKQLEGFSRRLLNVYRGTEYLKTFTQWDDAFRYFITFECEGKKILIIDEFQYMVKGNKTIPSILQNLWDENYKDQDILIALCGSSMSFIENEILGEKNPLYGRATGIYKMNQMKFDDVCKFYPKYSIEDKIITYSILDGIPHYLKQFDSRISVKENIIENILTKGSTLYNEVEFLMRQELRETNIYNTLISVIALGSSKLNDIHQKTQIDKAKIGVYLRNLIDLGIIEREFPITEKIKAKANVQRGLYRITDNYFKFWYRFLFPNVSELEEGEVDLVYDEYIQPYLNEHIAFVFEEVCMQYLRNENVKNKLPFRFTKIGRWWDKADEIDIYAFDPKDRSILGECKWSNEKVDLSVLEHLKEKAKKLKVDKPIFYLFSKSGFSNELKKLEAKGEGLVLVGLEELENGFQ